MPDPAALLRIINGQPPVPVPGGMVPNPPTMTAPQAVQASSIQFPGEDPPPITVDNQRRLTIVDGTVLPPPNVAINPQYSIFAPSVGGVGMPSKIVFFYRVQGYQMTETWYATGAIDTITPAILASYLNLRMAISGNNTDVDKVRVSQVGTKFSLLRYNLAQLQAAGLSFIRGTFTEAPNSGTNDPDTCLDIDCQSTSAGGVRHRTMFLRGIPDSVTQNGGQYVIVGDWPARFAAWTNYIINPARGWGWLGQPPNPTKYNITNITNPSGVITFTTGGAPFGAGPYPGDVSIRISNLPSPFRYLNGPLTVIPTAINICTSLRVMPFPPDATFAAGAGQLYKTQITATSQLFAMSRAEILGVGSRKAGKISGVHRGRQPNRKWS